MNEQTETGTVGETTTSARKKATATKRVARARISQAAIECPKPPVVSASAKEMANYLDSYANQLRRVAEQLRAKELHETVAVPWPPCPIIMNCNGGGDG